MSISVVFLITALLFNAAANVLMKVGARRFGEMDNLDPMGKVFALATNYPLIIGLVLFASNVVFYTLALRHIRINVAYPIMTGGGLAIITAASFFYLREHVYLQQWLGIFLIGAGIVLVASKMS